MLYLAGILITSFLVLILCSKRNKSSGDKILLLWLCCIALHLTLVYLYTSGNYTSIPFFLGLELPLPLLHGPFIFLYTSALTNRLPSKRNRALHFIPYLVFNLCLLPFYSSPLSYKIEIYQHEGLGYRSLLFVLYAAVLISGLVYSVLSFIRLRQHQQAIRSSYSYTEKINLRWMTYLILGYALIGLIVMVGNDSQVFTAVVIYIFYIGYFGIKQVGIFTNTVSVAEAFEITVNNDPDNSLSGKLPGEEKRPSRPKYERSGISQEELGAVHQKLQLLMASEKIYKNPELSLADVAEKIPTHPNTLSQVINSIEQKNFFDYINTQRIEEFKRLIQLPENQKFTLLSLAFDCGFNSKTSFNRNFKKATGISPSDYLKQKNINLTSL